MAKNQKKQKHAPPSDDTPKKDYNQRYFKSVEWKDFDTQFKMYRIINEKQEETLCMNLWNRVQFKILTYTHSNLSKCWNVEYYGDQFIKSINYDFSSIFARIWLDKYIDRIAESLHSIVYKQYRKFGEKEAFKEADKAYADFVGSFQ